MRTVKLKDFWEVLVDRKIAKKIFNDVEKDWFDIMFDFEWIRFIASSFADELFAKWFQKFWKKFKIDNIKDDFTKNMIKQVLLNRMQFQVQ